MRSGQSSDKIFLHYNQKKNREEVLEKTAIFSFEKTFQSSHMIGDVDFLNILMHGENTDAMKYLFTRDDVKGKIRLIYIDPPFATGRFFNGATLKKSPLTALDHAYDDRLQGPEFVEFLRERLILLHELLAEDGSIYVHIDWKMSHYVRVVMDEIFGPENFINEITRIKCNPKGMPRQGFGNYKDTILFYSKGPNFIWNDSREKFTEGELNRLFGKVDETGRRYTTFPLHANGEVVNGETGQPWRGRMPPKGSHWQYKHEDLDRLDAEGLIVWSKSGNPRRKVYADDAILRGKKRQDIWDFKDPPYPLYPTEKNTDMLKVIIEASSNKGDIVMDAFCGSGSTLLSAESLERHWIGIDRSPLAIRITKEKLSKIKNPHPYAVYEGSDSIRISQENPEAEESS